MVRVQSHDAAGRRSARDFVRLPDVILVAECPEPLGRMGLLQEREVAADNADVASILSAAEGACAAAKEQGRNRVHSFAENDIELMRRRREMQWAALSTRVLRTSNATSFPAGSDCKGRSTSDSP